MAALQVRKLVGDHEGHLLLALLVGELEHIGVDHDVVSQRESGGERVEGSTRLHDVDRRRLRQLHSLGHLSGHAVGLGELMLGHEHAVAAELAELPPEQQERPAEDHQPDHQANAEGDHHQ